MQLVQALEKGDLASTRKLLNKGANIEAKDPNGSTPIFVAVEYGNAALVKILLEHGARADVRNGSNATPLMEAARRDSTDTVDLLLQGNTGREALNEALFFAVEEQPVIVKTSNYVSPVPPAIRLLFGKGADVNARDEEGESPLMVAAGFGQLATTKFLVDRGADLEARDNYGNTALTRAACDCAVATMPDTYDVLKFLLERGVDINAKNKDGDTALMIASAGGVIKTKIVGLLLERGADQRLRNAEGQTALMIAKRDNVTDVIRLLMNPPTGAH